MGERGSLFPTVTILKNPQERNEPVVHRAESWNNYNIPAVCRAEIRNSNSSNRSSRNERTESFDNKDYKGEGCKTSQPCQKPNIKDYKGENCKKSHSYHSSGIIKYKRKD